MDERQDRLCRDGPAGPVPRKVQILELSVFLFLIVPSMVLSYFVIQPRQLHFTLVAVATILNDLAMSLLVMFFVWRNGEGLSALGWNARGARHELALGAFLFVPFFLLTAVFQLWLRGLGFAPPSRPPFPVPSGVGQLALAFLFLLVVAVTEETVFRGYLILRLSNISGHRTRAVLYSTLIFAIGHGYEGTAGVITVAGMGLVFALIYLWRGTLLAVMAMHFLQDFVAVVLVPLVHR